MAPLGVAAPLRGVWPRASVPPPCRGLVRHGRHGLEGSGRGTAGSGSADGARATAGGGREARGQRHVLRQELGRPPPAGGTRTLTAAAAAIEPPSSSSPSPLSDGGDQMDPIGSRSSKVVRHFVNLKNGIEALPELERLGVSYDFLRIQSTSREGGRGGRGSSQER